MEQENYTYQQQLPDYDKLGEETKKSLDELKKIANRDLAKDIVEQSKNSVKFAAIGAGVGIILALFYKRKIIPFAIGGAILGGLSGKITNLFKTKKS